MSSPTEFSTFPPKYAKISRRISCCYRRDQGDSGNCSQTETHSKTMSSPATYVKFTAFPQKYTKKLEEEYRAAIEETREIPGIGSRIVDPILDALDGENMKIKFYAPYCQDFIRQMANQIYPSFPFWDHFWTCGLQARETRKKAQLSTRIPFVMVEGKGH